MPIITAVVIEGYTPDARARLASALSKAAALVIPAAAEGSSVIIQEVASDNYMRGGAHRSPAPAARPADEVVLSYLSAMEARDLSKASEHLAEGFEMVFPGGIHMTELSELVEWAKPRYRSVTKTYTGLDTAPGTPVTVYARGTLAGEWTDGKAFSGIRFIDRFEMSSDLIVRQEVWNDIAEVRPHGN